MMKQSRRGFIISSSMFAFGWFLNKSGMLFAHHESHFGFEGLFNLNYFSDPNFEDQFPYSLPKLPYSYDALEPFIDKETMEIHHTKHHQGYINNLNKALENQTFKNAPITELFKKVSTLDKSIRNNAGGHYNHSLFWQMLKPNPNDEPNMPSDNLLKEINKHFQNFDSFRREFSEKALKLFGSGWCWLIRDKNNKLKIVTTPNQDNPLMDVIDEKDKGVPLLGIDVWEHAYYLKYQNRRADYIENFWKIVNWKFVETRMETTKR